MAPVSHSCMRTEHVALCTAHHMISLPDILPHTMPSTMRFCHGVTLVGRYRHRPRHRPPTTCRKTGSVPSVRNGTTTGARCSSTGETTIRLGGSQGTPVGCVGLVLGHVRLLESGRRW